MNKYLVLEIEKVRPVNNLGKGHDNLREALTVYLKDLTGTVLVKVINVEDIEVKEKCGEKNN